MPAAFYTVSKFNDQIETVHITTTTTTTNNNNNKNNNIVTDVILKVRSTFS